MRRLAVIFVILFGVSGCEYAAGNVALVVAGAGMTSVMYTDKTLLDHGASAANEQDCSTLYLENKQPYCRDWAGQEETPAMLYCYPTLGRPDCYVDPLPNRQSRSSYTVSSPES